VARLRGTSVGQAQAEVDALARAVARAHPDTNGDRGAVVTSDLRYRLESGGVNALALLGLVLLVVAVTCVNVANLYLARTGRREPEIGLRLALGASRARLLRQFLTETLLLGLLGAAAGAVVALWTVRLLPSFVLEPPGFQSFLQFRFDGRVLAFTLLVTLLTTVLFGVVPSWSASRVDVKAMLAHDRGAASGGRPRRLRSTLVAAQIAVSLALLAGAAVLARSFLETRRADLGFERKPLLLAWVTFGAPAQASAREAVRRLEALPGVTRVAVAIRAPLSLSGGGMAQPVLVPGEQDTAARPVEVKFNAVSTNYFETFGTRLLRGRLFTPADQEPGLPVIVVNERFARRFFPSGDPVGRVVRLGGQGGVDHRVVGVVGNAVINRVGEAPEPYFYLPFWRGGHGELTYAIESARDAGTLAAAARETLRGLDSRLDPRLLVTMAQLIDFSARDYRMTAALVAALGVVGLLLTSVGVYGIAAQAAGRRTRELGIRLALGATRGHVLRLLLSEGARQGAAGLTLGVLLALGVTHLMRSLLFGIGPWDPSSLLASLGVLCAALVAAYAVPAVRATRVDPSSAIREA
jgi:predicted permease